MFLLTLCALLAVGCAVTQAGILYDAFNARRLSRATRVIALLAFDVMLGIFIAGVILVTQGNLALLESDALPLLSPELRSW